jgi:putative ABC transport system substrate-binding protein
MPSPTFANSSGSNVAIDYRWAEGQYDRLPAMATELVRRQVAVIATGGLPAAVAAKAATTTIPIVFALGVDPVSAGLVASLARPDGNITGVTNIGAELGPKSLELLHEAAPTVKIFGVLINPANPNAEAVAKDLQAAGRTLGVQISVLRASTNRDIEMDLRASRRCMWAGW